ncbi:MAG TPA: hypothetical protein VFF66_09285 [Brevundimonas sp.]|nr:hypothetical protein [Brevundimonas sp.]
MNRAALFPALLLLAGCGVGAAGECRFDKTTCDHFAERAAQLQWVRTADPIRDGDAAIASGDPPLIGLYGYATYFPGLPAGTSVEGCRIRILEGTGDYLDRETAHLQRLAERYAETYNQRVWPHRACQTGEGRQGRPAGPAPLDQLRAS